MRRRRARDTADKRRRYIEQFYGPRFWAAPGAFGSVRAQLSLRQAFLWTDSVVVGKPELMVFQAGQRFDGDGNLVDPQTRELLAALLAALAGLIS